MEKGCSKFVSSSGTVATPSTCIVRYLGIHIIIKLNTLDWSDLCCITAAKATKCLVFLCHSLYGFSSVAKSIACKGIVRLIRMQLKCGNPHTAENIDILESVN